MKGGGLQCSISQFPLNIEGGQIPRGLVFCLWALHLTGVGFPPPRAVLGRHLQTGRVPSSAWRLRWHCPWTLGGHEVLVSNRCMDDRKFQDTVEKHPSTAGVTTIEPEDELVEVAWQVGRISHSVRKPDRQPGPQVACLRCISVALHSTNFQSRPAASDVCPS